MSMYKDIIGPTQAGIDIHEAYIWGLPKSGTIFTSIFFHVYHKLLNNEEITAQNIIHVNFSHYEFGKKYFDVTHSICPGFEETETDQDKLKQWYNLFVTRIVPWYGTDRSRLQRIAIQMQNDDKEFFDHTSIVFIFRNPLDQLVSHWNHINDLLPGDSPDLNDFIFNKNALDAYIKTFYSYHIVRQKYPENILCIPYEVLMHNKLATLRRIIDHLGIPFNEAAFVKAIELTSMDHLKIIEKKLQHSLLFRPNKTHMRNGGIGVWQDHMTPEMVQRIEVRLQEFGLSLKMFHLADELKPEFSFLAEDKTPAQSLRMRM